MLGFEKTTKVAGFRVVVGGSKYSVCPLSVVHWVSFDHVF